jgi:hypothetical protein
MADVTNPMVEGIKYSVALPLTLLAAVATYATEDVPSDYGDYITKRIYKFLWFCFWAAVFISIFAVGGIITVFIGIVYAYVAIYRKIKCVNSKIPDKSCDL